MIVRNPKGELEVSGTVVYLSDLWNYFDKAEIIKDMQLGYLYARSWSDETDDIEKFNDFLRGETHISGRVAKKYLDYKQFADTNVDIAELQRMMNQKFESFESIMRSILIALNDLKSQFLQDEFIGLKDIADSYSYRGKRIYTLKTLRNKISVKKIGNVEIGYLDIDDLHVTLIKRGMKWVTPLVHWQNERNKLSHDHFWRAFQRKKKFSPKVCAK